MPAGSGGILYRFRLFRIPPGVMLPILAPGQDAPGPLPPGLYQAQAAILPSAPGWPPVALPPPR